MSINSSDIDLAPTPVTVATVAHPPSPSVPAADCVPFIGIIAPTPLPVVAATPVSVVTSSTPAHTKTKIPAPADMKTKILAPTPGTGSTTTSSSPSVCSSLSVLALTPPVIPQPTPASVVTGSAPADTKIKIPAPADTKTKIPAPQSPPA